MILNFNNNKLQLHMSKDIKRDRQRPASAQPLANYTLRLNQPENQKNVFEREELIKNVYVRSKSAKLNRVMSTVKPGEVMSDVERVRKVVKKPRQEMAEEIVNLKLRINGLTQDLNHQRGKTEEIRKKYNKFAKVLNVEFENERVWNAGVINIHKVEGIRSMYDRLKEQYEKMKVHYLDLLKSSKITKELEYVHYIETLEHEIKGLYSRFERIEQNIVSILANAKKDEEISVKAYLLGDNEYQYSRLEEKYAKIRAKLEMKNQIIKDRQKKIVFLDRYVKELENKLRHETKNYHNLEKQLRSIQTKYDNKLKQSEAERHDAQRQIRELQKIIESQRQEFQMQKYQLIKDRDQKLADILEKNTYFQNTINELRKSNNAMAEQCQRLKNSTSTALNYKSKKQSDSAPQGKTISIKPIETVKSEQRKRPPSQAASKKSEQGSEKRVRQTADKPHNKNAVKKRRVQHQQIIQISSLMRYRVIGKGISLEQIKQLFVPKSTNSSQSLWQQEYINMKEMKDILLSEPFMLTEEQAELVSRYLIQDVKEEYVYVDQNNQNYRQVVKSIVKTLLGEYPKIEKDEKLQAEVKIFHNQYGSKINTILQGVAVDGKITKRKFLDVLKGSGGELSEDLIDLLIGKMSQKAENLNSLDFAKIFTDQNP